MANLQAHLIEGAGHSNPAERTTQLESDNSLLLSFAFTLSTANTAEAPTCQSYHHGNQGNYSNKESHDVKQIVLIPRDVVRLTSEVLGSMFENVLYPVTSFL